MSKKVKNIFVWLLPLLGIVLLALLMLKRAPETFEADKVYYSDVEDVDETLLAYKEVDGIGVELDKLHSLTLDNRDKIYVSGDNKLLILNTDGVELNSITLPAPAGCLAVSENEKIYIGFRKHVEVYDAAGKKLATWNKIEDDSFITSIAITDNFLFVADAGTRNVWKFDLKGKLLGKIGVENKKDGIPGFIVPSPFFDLTAATDGTIWVVNPGRHKLENFRVDGKLKGMWGKYSPDMEGFCGCCNPTHIALLKDGSFVTSEKGFTRIKIYDSKGVFSSIVAAENQFMKGTKGLDLAVDTKGRIIVLDPKMKKIRIFIKK